MKITKYAVAMLSLVVVLVFVSPVYADSLAGVSFSANNPTVTEAVTPGVTPGSVTFTISNFSGLAINTPNIVINPFPLFPAGDLTDTDALDPAGFELVGTTCGATLADQSTCTQTNRFVAGTGLDDTATPDSGTVFFDSKLNYNYNCTIIFGIPACTPGQNDLLFPITVQDAQPVTATPEPSSLLLLGTGLLGLAGMSWRKKLFA